MLLSNEEYELELKHLEDVKNSIRDTIKDKGLNIEEYKRETIESKKFIWQNQSDYSDKEMVSLMNEEDFKVDLINKDIVKTYKLYRSLESPYFSRIDFETDDKKETFYIGLTGIDRNYEPIVYDWRASVANLYYNFGLGRSHYDTIEGSVEGNTTLKRQFTIQMGEIKNVYDSTLGVRDEYLEESLRQSASEQMKNIVGTIQHEQNDIIRYPSTKNVVVEGTSGSGKTSVALHRIAYILYNRKNITNRNVLIFSPSEEFSKYISNVLPELGEENVPTTTFQELASTFIKNRKIEKLTDFAEKFYENASSTDIESLKFKLSTTYKEKIDEYLKRYFESLNFTKKFGLKKKFISSVELNALKKSIKGNLSFSDKVEYLSEKICASFKIDEIKNVKKMERFVRSSLSIPSDPIELYENFTKTSLESEVSYEDIFGILYLYFEIVGYPEYPEIFHVVIDEVQDYTPWQLEVIKKIFRSATFTVLGDKNQVINPCHKYTSLDELVPIFDAEYVRLNKAYRSSKEIVEFANAIIGEEDVVSVRGSKKEVVIRNSSNLIDIEKEIEILRASGYRSIGVIVKNKSAKEKLGFLSGEGVSVEEVYTAKGLEYDAVLVYVEKSNKFKENELNLLYIAVTRALHELIIYNQYN